MAPRNVPASAALALVASAVAGLLVAGVALPLVAAAGLAAKGQADEFLVLPTELETAPLPKRSRILALDGSVIAYLYTQNRVPVQLEQVPEHVRNAVLAVEDARFYEHNGVDVKGTVRAAVQNATSGRVEQGGSTLTQQYVKNALLQAAATKDEQARALEQSIDRKLREARYALALERELSKDEILERYLNIAYFGHGAYGIATAATTFFSKPVQELTVGEGAMLAGLVQSPGRYDPLRNLDAAVARRNIVLQRMAEVGMLTGPELVAAVDEVPDIRPGAVASGCEAYGVQAPFFCDYVRRALEDGELGTALGETREERQQRLLAGGLTIQTTLDPRMQAAAERALNSAVPWNDPSGLAGTYTVVEPGTGRVLAMAVNRTYSEKQEPGHTKLDLPLGASSGMQAGSTFKPFVLAAAIEMGIPLDLTLQAPGSYTSSVFKNCDGRSCDEPYTVNNAGDSSAGLHTVVSATHHSVNTYYLQLEERTGVERPAQIAEALGVRQFAGGTPSAPLLRGGSFVLGTNEVSPLAMAAAYAGFAAHGVYCPPRPVVEIRDAAGQPVPLPAPACRQAIAPEVADTVASVLRGTIDGPSPYRTGVRAQIGRPAAGKTGSTNGSRAAWFVGFTPQIAASVWVGKPVPEPLQGIRVGGRYYRQVYGGTLPAPIWADGMREIMTGMPVEPLPPMAVSRPRLPGPERDEERDEERSQDDRGSARAQAAAAR